MNPGQAPVGFFEEIELCLLTDPKNAEGQETHQVHHDPGGHTEKGMYQIMFGMHH